MKPWELIDTLNPADTPEEFPRVTIQSEAQLRDALEEFRQREPAILGLEGPLDQGLQIGLGGPFAGVRWAEHPASKRNGILLADQTYSEKRVDFTSEGDTIAFWPAELVPAEQAIQVIIYFYNNHHLPEWVTWKEWDPSRDRWIVKPAAKAVSA